MTTKKSRNSNSHRKQWELFEKELLRVLLKAHYVWMPYKILGEEKATDTGPGP